MNGPKIIFTIGNIPISETVVNTWIIMAVLIILAIIATRRLEKIPRGIQNVVEVIVDLLYGLVRDTMGADKMKFAPYIGTLFIFYWCSNIAGLFGLRSPTTDLNTTVSFALITFALVHINKLRSKGIKRCMKELMEPMPLMLPLNVVGELALPISLSFRPFGNITGGTVIMSLFYGALAYLSMNILRLPFPLLQAGIPAPFHLYFDVFAGSIQALIFTILTMVFVSNAID